MSTVSPVTVRAHYDQKYAERQNSSAEHYADVELPKFRDFIRSQDIVLDFGCGVGSILSRLHCSERIGVEINPAAAAIASSRGLRVVDDLHLVPEQSIDVVISNHALEHTENPLGEMRKLHACLKPGGTLVLPDYR